MSVGRAFEMLFLILLMVGAAAFISHRVGYQQGRAYTPSTDEEWVEYARDSKLIPCYFDTLIIDSGPKPLKRESVTSEATLASLEADGRFIPVGLNQDMAVPELCFAVEKGLFGIAVDFWMRPQDENHRQNKTIPYWNPNLNADRFRTAASE